MDSPVPPFPDSPDVAEKVALFRSITEASEADAWFHVRAADGNVEIAVNHFFTKASGTMLERRQLEREQSDHTKPPARTASSTAAVPGLQSSSNSNMAPKPPAPLQDLPSVADEPPAAPSGGAAPRPAPAKKSSAVRRPATRRQRDALRSDSSSSDSTDDDEAIVRACQEVLRGALVEVRVEIGQKLKISANGVLPKVALDFLVCSLDKPNWGSVEDLREVFTTRISKYGPPILRAYRRVRAQYLHDTYELTDDEEQSMGAGDTWRTIDLASVRQLQPAPSQHEFMTRIAHAAMGESSVPPPAAPPVAPAASSSVASARPAPARRVRTEQAPLVNVDVDEVVQDATAAHSAAPSPTAIAAPRKPLVQRRLDGSVAARPAEPVAPPTPAASPQTLAPGPRTRRQDGNVIRPASSVAPQAAATPADVQLLARALNGRPSIRLTPPSSRGEPPAPLPVTVYRGRLDLSCLGEALEWLKPLCKARAHDSNAQRTGNFVTLAAALTLACPSCVALPTQGKLREAVITMAAKQGIVLANKITTASNPNGSAPPPNRPVPVELVYAGWSRSGTGTCGCRTLHSLVVAVANLWLSSSIGYATDFNWVSQICHVEIQVGCMRPHPADYRPAMYTRDAMWMLLEHFGHEDALSRRGEYPYITNEAAAAWQGLCDEECTTPAQLLQLTEKTTAAVGHANDVEAQLPGIALELKRHQRHSVGLMLYREKNGHRDDVPLTLSSGVTLYLNLVTCSLTYDGSAWQTQTDATGEVRPPTQIVHGGILADEMGLGKTLAVISLAALNPATPEMLSNTEDVKPRVVAHVEKDYRWGTMLTDKIESARPTPIKATLIVVPVSITGQWMAEVSRCAPDAKILLFHGTERSRYTTADFAAADFVVTTYETLNTTLDRERGSLAQLVKQVFTNAALGEALDRVRVLGASRLKHMAQSGNSDAEAVAFWITMNCPLLFTSVPLIRLSALHFHRVVFDECQKVHTWHAQDLSARYWWASSGTPVDSTIEPLRNLCGVVGWSVTGRNAIFSTHRFGIDVTRWGFSQNESNCATTDHRVCRDAYQLPQNAEIDSCVPLPGRTDGVIQVMSGMWAWAMIAAQYIIRHAKTAAVAEEIALPQRTIVAHVVTLSSNERRLYDEIETTLRAEIRSLMARERLGSRVSFLLMWIDKLRRAAAHPALVEARQEDELPGEADDGGRSPTSAAPPSRGAAGENVKFSIKAVAAKEVLETAARHRSVSESTMQMLERLSRIPPEFDDCVVCLELMQAPTMLKCGHFYCRECVLRVIAESARNREPPKCPTCRQYTMQAGITQVLVASSAPQITPAQREQRDAIVASVGHGSKIVAAIALIRDVLSKDSSARFVVFSTYPAMMRRVATALSQVGISLCVIDGSTALKTRARMIQQFQTGSTTVCIISSRVGNAGLTLTAANHLILLEPNTNVAVDAQAMGRIHRFGQTRPVTIHRLVTKDTVEERIQKLIDGGRLDVDDQEQRAIRKQPTTTSKLGLEQMKRIVLGDHAENIED
jgi:SNF2 family DNA or RNA helicase